MTRSLLSDEETEDLLHLSAGGNHVGVVKYVNRLLHEKSQGTDPCARPFSLRKQNQLEPPCFALGYIDTLVAYLRDSHARAPQTVVADVEKFADKLKLEITSFFKEPPCQKM